MPKPVAISTGLIKVRQLESYNTRRSIDIRANLDISGNVSITNNVIFSDPQNATSTTAAAIVVKGGMSVNKNLNVNGNLCVGNIDGTNKILAVDEKQNRIGVNLPADGALSSFHIATNDALIVPKGTLAQRPGSVGVIAPQHGMIRLNTETNHFEGYSSVNDWGPLGGGNLEDADADTKILVEKTTDEDIIKFYTQGSQRMIMSNDSRSGNIGIGKDFMTPNAVLDVHGNMSVGSNLVVGSAAGAESYLRMRTGKKIYLSDSNDLALSSDGTDVTLVSKEDINLTTGPQKNINVLDRSKLTFTSDDNFIEGDDMNLLMNANGGDIKLTARNDRAVRVINNQDATISQEAALVVNGGVTIKKNLNVKSNVIVESNMTVATTGYLRVPVGSTTQRPSAVETGMIRYNNEQKAYEGYGITSWGTLGGAIDVDKDTRVQVEESPTNDDDIMRFYTQAKQRMMICNSSQSGRIGIGLGFNAPKSTLDILGNLNVSGNGTFGKQIKIGHSLSTETMTQYSNAGQSVPANILAVGEEGMIRYDGKTFEGYTESYNNQKKWVSLVNTSDVFSSVVAIPYQAPRMQVYNVLDTYKKANLVQGLLAEGNSFGLNAQYEFSRLYATEQIILQSLRLSHLGDGYNVNSNTINTNGPTYSIKIIMNETTAQPIFAGNATEFITTALSGISPTIPDSVTVPFTNELLIPANSYIEVHVKVANAPAGGIKRQVMIDLIGEKRRKDMVLNGNFTGVYNTSAQFKYNLGVNLNLAVSGNATIVDKLNTNNGLRVSTTSADRKSLEIVGMNTQTANVMDITTGTNGGTNSLKLSNTGNLDYVGKKISNTGITVLSNTNNSDANSTSGALRVDGGVRINKNLSVGQNVRIHDTDDVNVADGTQGSVQMDGGLGVLKKLVVVGGAGETDIESGSNFGSGSLIVRGGADVQKRVRVGSNQDTSFGNTTDGALYVAGGVNIKKKLQIWDGSSIANIDNADPINANGQQDGAFKSKGGIAIDNQLKVMGKSGLVGLVMVHNNNESNDLTSGALTVKGGVGITKNLNVGHNVNIASVRQATSANDAALTVKGGVGITKDLFVGGSFVLTGSTKNENTLDSNSPTTGGFVVGGGAGIAKNLNIGQNVNVYDKFHVFGTQDVSGGNTYSSSGASVKVAGSAIVQNSVLIKSTRDNLTNGDATAKHGINTNDGTLNASLVVQGGADIQHTLQVGFNADGTPTQANWSDNKPNSGELLVRGGTVVDQNIWVRGSGGGYDLTESEIATESVSAAGNGALQVDGGVRFKQNVRTIGNTDIGGITTIHNVKEVDNATKKGAFTLYGGGYVHKDFTVKGNVNILNNLNIKGNVTAINTDQVLVDDPLIVLGLNQTDSNNLFDSGLLSRYTSAGGLRFTGLVKDGAGEYSLVTDIPNKAGKPLEADLQTGYFTTENKLENLNMKQLKVKSTIESTSATNGGLIVDGGVGIAKNLNVGSSLTVNNGTTKLNNLTDSVKPTGANIENNGALLVHGGVAIRMNLNVKESVGVYGNLLVADNKRLYFSEDNKQYISRDDTDKLSIHAKANILLKTENGGKVRIPTAQGLHFNESSNGEYIITDSNNLKMYSSKQIVLTSTEKTKVDCADVIELDSDVGKIEYTKDSSNRLTIDYNVDANGVLMSANKNKFVFTDSVPAPGTNDVNVLTQMERGAAGGGDHKLRLPNSNRLILGNDDTVNMYRTGTNMMVNSGGKLDINAGGDVSVQNGQKIYLNRVDNDDDSSEYIVATNNTLSLKAKSKIDLSANDVEINAQNFGLTLLTSDFFVKKMINGSPEPFFKITHGKTTKDTNDTILTNAYNDRDVILSGTKQNVTSPIMSLNSTQSSMMMNSNAKLMLGDVGKFIHKYDANTLKIESDADMCINTSGSNNLIGNINIPQKTRVTFGGYKQYMEGRDNELFLASNNDIELDAKQNIVLNTTQGNVFFKKEGDIFLNIASTGTGINLDTVIMPESPLGTATESDKPADLLFKAAQGTEIFRVDCSVKNHSGSAKVGALRVPHTSAIVFGDADSPANQDTLSENNYIRSDPSASNRDLVVYTANDIHLKIKTADNAVKLDQQTKLSLNSSDAANQEYLKYTETDGITMASTGDINLTTGTDKNVNLLNARKLTFGNDVQHIVSDTNDLLMSATAGDIKLTAKSDKAVKVMNDQDATISQEGALVVNGGVTIKKNLNVKSNVIVESNMTVATTGYLRVPVGSTTQRPSAVETGMIRYNNEQKAYEGYGISSWGTLGGAIDVDKDTRVQVEESPTNDDDIMKFFTQGSQRMMIANTPSSGAIQCAVAVGLNFNTPKSTLDVLGNFNVSSNVNIGDKHKLTWGTGQSTESIVGDNVAGNVNVVAAKHVGVATGVAPTNLIHLKSYAINASCSQLNLHSTDANEVDCMRIINSSGNADITTSTVADKDIIFKSAANANRVIARIDNNLSVIRVDNPSNDNANKIVFGNDANVQNYIQGYGPDDKSKLKLAGNVITLDSDYSGVKKDSRWMFDIDTSAANFTGGDGSNKVYMTWKSNENTLETKCMETTSKIVTNVTTQEFNTADSIPKSYMKLQMDAGTTGDDAKRIVTNGALIVNQRMVYTPELISSISGNYGTASVPITLSTSLTGGASDSKVLTIVNIDASMSSIMYLKLENGNINGQIKKIALHPNYEINHNNKHVDIDIPRFCDPDGGYATAATLILNRGGQTLNLIWIDDNATNGYWMLMDNNFDFA
tara:strand:- start:8191 stop:16371 length:8181 start_codon:yes stop_codon:yes gene_type:complete